MSLTAAAARGAFWSMLETWGVRGVSFVAFLVLARLLSPDDFGLMALASIYLMVLSFLIDQGLNLALIQRERLEPEHLDAAFWLNVAVGLSLALITVFAAGLVARAYGEPRLAPLLRVLALLPLMTSLTLVQQAYMRRHLRFRALAARQIVSAVAGAALGLTLAAFGHGVWSLVAQLLFGALVGLVVLWAASDWRPRLRFSLRHARELLAFSGSVAGEALLHLLGAQIDRLVLGRVAGVVPVGFYTVAQRLVAIVAEVLLLGVQGVVIPVFSRVQHDREALRRGLFKAHRLVAFVALPAFVGVVLIAPELVRLLLGAKWDMAAPIARVLAVQTLFFALGFFLGQVLVAMGRPGLRLALTAAQTILTAAAVLWAAPRGAVAVAEAMATIQVAVYAATLLVLRPLVGLPIGRYLAQSAVPLAATAAMAAAVALIRPAAVDWPTLAAVAAEVAVGATVYALLTLLFARAQWREFFDLARALRTPPPAAMT